MLVSSDLQCPHTAGVPTQPGYSGGMNIQNMETPHQCSEDKLIIIARLVTTSHQQQPGTRGQAEQEQGYVLLCDGIWLSPLLLE